MKQLLLVFLGGGFGSVARYALGRLFNSAESTFPYGTFIANILGSLAIGIILGYLAKTTNISDNQSLLLATGFCGGFTTFSAFAYENHLYLKSGDYFSFLIYTFGSIIIGLIAVFIGLYVSKLI